MSARRSDVAGDAATAERLADGDLADVPQEVLVNALRLPLHEHLGLRLVGLRPVTVELALSERTRTFGGPLHGGAVSTLADVAGNAAAATSGHVDITRYGLVTVRLHVDLHAQPRGDRVTARAVAVEGSRRAVVCSCRVTDAEGRHIASATITSRLVPGGGLAIGGLAGEPAC